VTIAKTRGAIAVAALSSVLALSIPAMAQMDNGSGSSAGPSTQMGATHGSGSHSGADSQHQLDIAAARAERKAVVGENMNLTPAQAKVFWPVYDQYEKRMDKIEDRHVREVRSYVASYQNLTDADATRKLDEVMAIQQARLDVQREFIPKFRAVISPILVTRFYQIDNKLHAMVQCHLAQMIPLARPASAPENSSDQF
jgi:Spy/CpxP family protein refolding chaperone